MTTADPNTLYRENTRSSFNAERFEDLLHTQVLQALQRFKEVTRGYALFHMIFFLLGISELIAFVLFFSFLTQSAILAFSLAGIFLTGFSYFLLLFYFQAKKPEHLLRLRSTFLEHVEALSPFERHTAQHRECLIQGIEHFFKQLDGQEYGYYPFFRSLSTLGPLMQKFSVWCHWKDVHQMKEILLQLGIKETISLIKLSPTALEPHAHLAHLYWTLAQLHQDPESRAPEQEHLWISPVYGSTEMRAKFKQYATRALEELKIIHEYAPEDPWVHAQLATLYRELEETEEEIRHTERLLQLNPHSCDILFRLGVLYFARGRHAHALRIYEELQQLHPTQAAELLTYYDAYALD